MTLPVVDPNAPVIDPNAPAGDPPAADPTDPVDPPDLGDAGKQAIARMKAERNEERQKRIALERQLAEATKPVIDPDKPDLEALREEARREAKAEADSAATARIVSAEVRALATGQLANPALALKLLDLSKFELNSDGSVDQDDVNTAIAALIKENPGLAATQGGRRFEGSGDMGPRNAPAGSPVQVTEAELKTMSAEQVVQARKEGRLASLLKPS